MKRQIISIIFILFITSPLASFCQSFEKDFATQYEKAILFLAKNKKKIYTNLAEYGDKKAFIVSLAFPEIVRYNEVQDVIETSFVELLYINYGQEGANFSIGHFQMRPSFIQSLEKYIIQIKPSIAQKIAYKATNKKYIRQERIERMKNLDWQLFYLGIFYELMKHKFNITQMDEESQLKFCATAYNWGFETSKEKIIEKQAKKTFPYGVKSAKSYSYADIALTFYRKNKKMFN